MAICACDISEIKDTMVLHLIGHRFPDAEAEIFPDQNVAIIHFCYPGLRKDEHVEIRIAPYFSVNHLGVLTERSAVIVGRERLTDAIINIFLDYKNFIK